MGPFLLLGPELDANFFWEGQIPGWLGLDITSARTMSYHFSWCFHASVMEAKLLSNAARCPSVYVDLDKIVSKG